MGLLIVAASNGDLESMSRLVKNSIPEPKNILLTCQQQSGATPSDIETLKMKKLPQTKTGKCMLECIFTNVKLLEDGRFNKVGMVAVFAPAAKGDLTKLRKLKEFADQCEKEIGNQRLKDCEGASKVLECVATNGKNFGFSVGSASVQ